MSRRRKYHYYSSKGLTKEEKFRWILVIIIFIVGFLIYFSYGILTNCVFHWPIRWDVMTCWNEQVNPAKEKAAEKAANFVP